MDKARKKLESLKPSMDGQLSLAHRTKMAAAMVAAAAPGKPPLAAPVIREADGKHEMYPLDATVIDVYKGAHAVVFMVDPSKTWTYDYVLRELAKTPLHIPCCVLARQFPVSSPAFRPPIPSVALSPQIPASNNPLSPIPALSRSRGRCLPRSEPRQM